MERFANQKIAKKKKGTFCGKNQALLMNDLPTYLPSA